MAVSLHHCRGPHFIVACQDFYPNELGEVTHTCSLHTCDIEIGSPGVQSHLQLHNAFKVSLKI